LVGLISLNNNNLYPNNWKKITQKIIKASVNSKAAFKEHIEATKATTATKETSIIDAGDAILKIG